MRLRRSDRRGRSGSPPSHALVGAVIGDLEGPTAIVDDHGRVGAIDGSWWLEWGVGAEDRWRIAHDEIAVRQSRVDDAPVYETWMRVPGGDVIQRVASANDGRGRTLVVEVENASASAVAIAVVGRVAGPATLAATPEGIALDADPWIRSDRQVGGTLVADGDPWPGVIAGPEGGPAGPNTGPALSAALVVALPHRQSVRFEARIEGEFPERAATAAVISSGWRTVTADAMTIVVPEAALGEAWSRIVPDLVVQAGSSDSRVAAEAAVVLDIAGLHEEADRARAVVVAAAEDGLLRGPDAVAALRALASRELLAGAPSGLDQLAGLLADAAGDAIDPVTLRQVARALDATAPEAADDARLMAGRTSGSFEPITPAGAAARQVLGRVVSADTADRIELLPEAPPAWRGGQIDVRGCGTPNGRVSFSVRWHGPRPALLWERTGGSDAIELRCPGLDPTWSTLDRSGEALLAAPPE